MNICNKLVLLARKLDIRVLRVNKLDYLRYSIHLLGYTLKIYRKYVHRPCPHHVCDLKVLIRQFRAPMALCMVKALDQWTGRL